MKKHGVMLSACLVAALTAATAAAVNTERSDRQSSVNQLLEQDRKHWLTGSVCTTPIARTVTALALRERSRRAFEISIIAERGGKQPPDLTDPAWDHGSTDTEIFTVIKKGIPSGDDAALRGAPLGRRDPECGGVRPFPLVVSGGDHGGGTGPARVRNARSKSLTTSSCRDG